MNHATDLVIRADADASIGTGHIMRMLALAQGWLSMNRRVVFVTRCLNDSIKQRLSREGCDIVEIGESHPAEADWLALSNVLSERSGAWVAMDGYHFDPGYCQKIIEHHHRLLVVDDLMHMDHYESDILLNQNAGSQDLLYPSKKGTMCLLGVSFIMLRKEFLKYRGTQKDIPKKARKILLSQGGGDALNSTMDVLASLLKINDSDLEVIVVVGPASPHAGAISDSAAGYPFKTRVVFGADNMPELMRWADLAIICAGGTLWEALFMGCPVLSLALNDVQDAILRRLEKRKIAVYPGKTSKLDSQTLTRAIQQIKSSQKLRQTLSRNGQILVDGDGVKKIIRCMNSFSAFKGEVETAVTMNGTVELFPFADKHISQTFSWVEKPSLQRDFLIRKKPTLRKHEAYFRKKLKDTNEHLFAVLYNDEHVGNCGFKNICPFLEAELWLYIGKEEVRGRGIGMQAARRLTEYGLKELHLKKIYLHVADFNQAAISLYRKTGFRIVRSEQSVQWRRRGVKVIRMELSI